MGTSGWGEWGRVDQACQCEAGSGRGGRACVGSSVRNGWARQVVGWLGWSDGRWTELSGAGLSDGGSGREAKGRLVRWGRAEMGWVVR